jgi:hypothetical protein
MVVLHYCSHQQSTKNAQLSLIIQKVQTKTTMRHYVTPERMGIKKTYDNKCWNPLSTWLPGHHTHMYVLLPQSYSFIIFSAGSYSSSWLLCLTELTASLAILSPQMVFVLPSQHFTYLLMSPKIPSPVQTSGHIPMRKLSKWHHHFRMCLFLTCLCSLKFNIQSISKFFWVTAADLIDLPMTIFFGSTERWTQGLTLARQVFNHLSHSTTPLCLFLL